jgi:two-component system alkaline phosphatase synthesis response regulator PhoP
MMAEKVMIIDDNKEFLEELKESLFLCGYECRALSDSAKAWRVARRIRPDVILLDLKMAGHNGFQVASDLKRDKETSGIPIIAMSGYFPIEDKSALLDLSLMDRRIKKPFEIADLITEIESVLNRRKEEG